MLRLLFLFLTILFTLPALAQVSVKPEPFMLGLVDRLNSRILHEERRLNIFLPEGYNSDDTTRYAVIYLLDGSADEDFIHVSGAVQFLTFPWVNQCPKSIVVGIANVDRRRDFSFPSTVAKDKAMNPTSGHSADFIAFLETELQPYIERQYRTAGPRTLIGESLGGLLATEILLKKPTLFDNYLIVSPSLWWDDGSLLKLDSPVYGANFTRKTAVYIACGKEGLAPSESPHVMELDANILADRLQGSKSRSLRVTFDYLPGENHATIGHLAVFSGLRALFAGK